jgi:hypothetical protein
LKLVVAEAEATAVVGMVAVADITEAAMVDIIAVAMEEAVTATAVAGDTAKT